MSEWSERLCQRGLQRGGHIHGRQMGAPTLLGLPGPPSCRLAQQPVGPWTVQGRLVMTGGSSSLHLCVAPLASRQALCAAPQPSPQVLGLGPSCQSRVWTEGQSFAPMSVTARDLGSCVFVPWVLDPAVWALCDSLFPVSPQHFPVLGPCVLSGPQDSSGLVPKKL